MCGGGVAALTWPVGYGSVENGGGLWLQRTPRGSSVPVTILQFHALLRLRIKEGVPKHWAWGSSDGHTYTQSTNVTNTKRYSCCYGYMSEGSGLNHAMATQSVGFGPAWSYLWRALAVQTWVQGGLWVLLQLQRHREQREPLGPRCTRGPVLHHQHLRLHATMRLNMSHKLGTIP